MASTAVLKTDYEALLSRFQQLDTIRYEEFTAIWREMKFSTIFCGKIGNMEKNKFTREALSIASEYFLPPYTFQIRVGSLYLLYGLYNTQPCQPKQKIRIALKDWDTVLKFQNDIVSAQHYDAAYIIRKLRTDKAFHFTAMPKLLSYRTKKNTSKANLKEEFTEKSNRVIELVTVDSLMEMKNIHDHYQRIKCLTSADKTQPDKALNLVNSGFVAKLRDITLDYQRWQQNKKERTLKTEKKGELDEGKNEEGEGTSQESEGSERARKLAQIKSRSYYQVAQAPKSRRHRQATLESSTSGADYEGTEVMEKRRKRRRKKSVEGIKKEASGDCRETMTMEVGTSRPSMPVVAEEGCEEAFPLPKRKRTH
ncbi:snRNA-activating protein complex subunit 1b [Latimeria chalumnae]|uniref:Small nuclear RNA activating complex polypeptide 1 n=1 Tax=Latimeria chalumnae TaxID=7897 RepID=H3BFU3_LATCH|nr:PREDICTED: snRNA-activating protein complex subunit 1 [Latimeria chalumnae]XP_005986471.1 PREDICTED: snRNA-activating protein complex subunit 1 [Latimeria chalumnae]XP_005986472.1 PREDICTED: snRNA-activating protein complex subunit 1 [Latimeria chalumnae]XP_005986473.1 PREDICTED: snRNA-activating protein complex subunit 1 [Latimeria chalumnae]|eukprot:XP_005986470.1 PREDICTED: snRNA-activating protein complex subunit 1 [Latimeria chalumnae]